MSVLYAAEQLNLNCVKTSVISISDPDLDWTSGANIKMDMCDISSKINVPGNIVHLRTVDPL